MMKTKRINQKNRRRTSASLPRHKQPLIEHLRELKRRVIMVAICVVAGSIVAYAIESRLVELLLKPSNGQHFIYTSPLGGMNFLLTVCLQIGLIVSTPVIMYNLLAFAKPLMRRTSNRFLILSSLAASLAAAAGLLFGYFIGLPSALHFLLHQFTTVQVKPLLTIQSYVSFVAVYLLGSALMFQLPLIILFINRIKPLKPSHLLKYERHALVGSFLIAFIMNPTPNVVDQLLVVVPVLLMYQLSIVMLWFINRHSQQRQQLTAADTERQLQRRQAAAKRQPLTTKPIAVEAVSPSTAQPMPNLDAAQMVQRRVAQATYVRRLVQ